MLWASEIHPLGACPPLRRSGAADANRIRPALAVCQNRNIASHGNGCSVGLGTYFLAKPDGEIHISQLAENGAEHLSGQKLLPAGGITHENPAETCADSIALTAASMASARAFAERHGKSTCARGGKRARGTIRAGRLYSNVLRTFPDPALSETTQRSLALYLFRQYITSGSQFTLVRNGETLYSGSDYDLEKILDGASEKTVTIEGKRLFLASGRTYTENDNTYQIFLLRDISSVFESITALTWRFVLICGSAFLLSAGVIMLCTFRALNPLKALQRSAANMAGGVYDQRISVHGTDEIAALACASTKMADAVSTHINAVTRRRRSKKLLLAR